MYHHKQFLIIPLLLSLFTTFQVYAGPGKDLRRAAKTGDFKAAEVLLSEGVNPNVAGKKGGGTPLIKAAKGNHIDIVQLLLLYGADPEQKNKKGRSAIDVAERNEHHDIVDIMQYGTNEQAVTIGVKKMTQKYFSSLMNEVLRGRKWEIEKTEKFSTTAAYRKGKRIYKVEASLHNERITIRFLRGYGSKRLNYLNNLKSDLKKKL